jgi:hypothetical protein
MNILIAVDGKLMIARRHTVSAAAAAGCCCVCIVAAVAEAALRLASASPWLGAYSCSDI